MQQWIDDIREAHHDEIDALQHERDAALADEVSATQSALEAMRSKHLMELELERSKLSELQHKADRLTQLERDLLIETYVLQIVFICSVDDRHDVVFK